jgi:hypothetical protein
MQKSDKKGDYCKYLYTSWEKKDLILITDLT